MLTQLVASPTALALHLACLRLGAVHVPVDVGLTDVEVATRLGVSRFTVRSWRLKGQGPRFLKMGRAVRYRTEDVDDYERQALVETQAQSDRAPA